jgi:hypothetical protein
MVVLTDVRTAHRGEPRAAEGNQVPGARASPLARDFQDVFKVYRKAERVELCLLTSGLAFRLAWSCYWL